MAIRIRKIKNSRTKSGFSYIALCAAEHKSQKGDLYLNDGKHEALSEKFTEDFKLMGFYKEPKKRKTKRLGQSVLMYVMNRQ